MHSISDVWKTVLDRLRGELSETSINTWFEEVDVVTMEDSAFVLHCNNSFAKSTIETRFVSYIKEALRDIFSSDLEVKILDDVGEWKNISLADGRQGWIKSSDIEII